MYSTPVRAEGGEPKCSLEEEITEERGEDEEEGNQEDEKGDKEKDLDSLEWEMRNTDSVFSELSELSQEYVESVDHGVSVRGKCKAYMFGLKVDLYGNFNMYICTSQDMWGLFSLCGVHTGSTVQFEEILSQYEELKQTQ